MTDNLINLPGVGAKRAHSLYAAGIKSISGLLDFLPRSYSDRSVVMPLASLVPGMVQTVRGRVAAVPTSARFGKMTLVKAILADDSGTLEIIWFNQPYMASTIKPDVEYIFTGMVKQNMRLQMHPSDYEAVTENMLGGQRIVPLYTVPAGFSQKTWRKLVDAALKMADASTFAETLPPEITAKYGLASREAALRNIHFPASDELFHAARRRLVFEELLGVQLRLSRLKAASQAAPGPKFSVIDPAPLLVNLPFTLTAAQARALEDIRADISGKHRMNRLIQGDVGSGKTAIAMAAAYLAAASGYQAAIMAPTEVLARQLYDACEAAFIGHAVALLIGGQTAAQRKNARAAIACGDAHIIVGTHAIVQKGVKFHSLGLVITDEQHRFGVNQRFTLHDKDSAPHVLVMTATPIPRTLGLILYGDLDISIVDSLPPGRMPIKTYCVNSGYRARLHAFIEKECAAGNQAYVICPAIDSESDIKSVVNHVAELSQALPHIKIAHLHGRMKSDAKDEIMHAFKRGETQVLVSTTVVEVGVHAPGATLMIIENAERFGLSQLHQLRGRVGRGTAQSYCILVTDATADITHARMRAMTGTTDGFRLAELDLEQRGTGDFFGTRQHGLPDFKIANLYTDLPILEHAQQAARDMQADSAAVRMATL